MSDASQAYPQPALAVTERAAPPPAAQPLFRPEVLVEHQNQWLGTVLLEPRVTHWMFAGIGLLAAVAVISLLFFTSYTRKARVNGWLVPEQGLVRVFAPQPGVVARIHVREGIAVRKGEPLLTLSAEMQSESMGATRQEIVRRLERRRDSTAAERAVQERLLDQQEADLARRLAAIRDELGYLREEMELQRSRLKLSERVAGRTRAMRARDIVPEPRLEEAERERIEEAAKLQSLERTQAALQREQMQMDASLKEIPLRRQTQVAEIERNVAALEQEIAEAELRRETIVTAPQDGLVTGLQVEPGGGVQGSVPLMSIVPQGAVLEAHLFSPSRAIGFLKEGQRVLLRYEAFPYQKFGFHEGVVAAVSRSALSPGEMSQHLSGLPGLTGANEPVYRVTVALRNQTVLAYGNAMPLQPGMQLEADVLLESRRLVEWMLEPLYSISGKWTS